MVRQAFYINFFHKLFTSNYYYYTVSNSSKQQTFIKCPMDLISTKSALSPSIYPTQTQIPQDNAKEYYILYILFLIPASLIMIIIIYCVLKISRSKYSILKGIAIAS